jgi:hypothetical protein
MTESIIYYNLILAIDALSIIAKNAYWRNQVHFGYRFSPAHCIYCQCCLFCAASSDLDDSLRYLESLI